MECIKRRSLLLKASAVKRAGQKSLLADDKEEEKRERGSNRNCTIKMMESVQIESKRTDVGSNIETNNGQKSDIALLGLSFGNYISK